MFSCCVNGNRPFDGQIGFGTHSVRQCKVDGDGADDDTCKRNFNGGHFRVRFR